jgi:hypothetical protein
VRDDFNITEMRAEGQDLPSPFIVTIPASRPVSSTHITSIDLWGDANPLGWLAHERTHCTRTRVGRSNDVHGLKGVRTQRARMV